MVRSLALLVVAVGLAACSGSSASSPSAGGDAPVPAPPPAGDADAGPDATGSAPPAPPPALGTYFPPPDAGGAWDTIDPETAGFDPAKLADLATFVEQAQSSSFMILYDGRIVLEKYWRGATPATTTDIASAQKSVTALLVGAAVAEGALSIDDTVTSALGDGWSNGSVGDEAGITIRHLLTMTSGLDENLEHDAAPGTVWLYNTNAYHRLELVLESKTGETLQDFTREALFDPIGAGPSAWAKRVAMKDAKGVPVSALEMTARDMARVGLLVMTRGAWNGQQVLPAAWIDTAVTPSQPLNPSYGFLFWLNGQASYLLPPKAPHTGTLMPHAPPDVAAALGAKDQKIYASPSTKLVVTRQGSDAGDGGLAASTWDDVLWTHIMDARKK
jgi:CubicO group peptidase (beta-lactamase class C family)